MDSKKRVAGYVKLAKLWEKRREAAMPYHNQYYCEKYADSDRFELAGVYVDITGNKKNLQPSGNDAPAERLQGRQDRLYRHADKGLSCG